MNKTELVKAVAEATGVSRKDVDAVINAVVATAGDVMAKGEDLRIPGFGIFTTRKRAEKTARNLHTGETVVVPASTVPAFKPGKELKAKVNA